jgi:hypothetical protein
MRSLTSFLPVLAPLFGLSEQALYERQRALVRLGMLKSPKGRGRGSGAELSPENVSRLLIAALATDSTTEIDERVQKLASAPFRGKVDQCPFTGTRTFGDALSFLLSEAAPIPPWPKTGGRASVRVNRNECSAVITWMRRGRFGQSQFGLHDQHDQHRTILRYAEMQFEVLRSIRKELPNGETTD